MADSRLMIATPCYGGMITTAYFQSMLKTVDFLNRSGIAYEIFTKANESLITRARNAFVAEFMGRKEFSHLLFIDADIGFEPELIGKMLNFNKPVTAAAYPTKGINWERVRKLAARAKDGQHLRDLSMHYTVNFVDADDKPYRVKLSIEDGFIKVPLVSTGFLMIRREVFETMRALLPDTSFVNDIPGHDSPHARSNFHTFFDTLVHPKSRRYLSEDYAFCYKWVVQCNGEIYLNVEHRLTHYGTYPFSGSLLAAAQDEMK
jgi:hypothetical protein